MEKKVIIKFESEHTDEVEVSNHDTSFIIVKQGSDSLWLHKDDVPTLIASLSDVLQSTTQQIS